MINEKPYKEVPEVMSDIQTNVYYSKDFKVVEACSSLMMMNDSFEFNNTNDFEQLKWIVD